MTISRNQSHMDNFRETRCTHHRTHCIDQQCPIHEVHTFFMAQQEWAHPYYKGWTFSQTSKATGEEAHQSDWPLAQKTHPTTFHTITDTGECLQRKPYPFIVGFVNYAHWIMFTLPLKFDNVPAGSSSLDGSRFASLSVSLRQHLITHSAFFGKSNCTGLSLEVGVNIYDTTNIITHELI